MIGGLVTVEILTLIYANVTMWTNILKLFYKNCWKFKIYPYIKGDGI
jgi:hypothetical protein